MSSLVGRAISSFIEPLVNFQEKLEDSAQNGSAAAITNGEANGSSEPAYGKRLIVQTVEDLAACEPDRVWATYSLGQDIDGGFRDLTTKQLANAVNKVAWWLDGNIGRSDSFEVLAYVGTSDLRYAVLFFAAVKCGYVVRRSLLDGPFLQLFLTRRLVHGTIGPKC